MALQLAGFCNQIYEGVILKNLKYISAILLALTLSLIIAIVVVSHSSNEEAEELVEKKQRICLTPGCIQRASSVLDNMDPSKDPCDDFFKFACGGFLNKTYIPDDQAAVNSITRIRNLVYQQIRSMLEETTEQEEIKPFTLTRKFYNLCVNTTAIEADGLTTIKEILDSLGGWPILEGTSWYEAKFDWKQSMYALRNIGYEANYFLSVKVITDLMNSSQRVISIDQAALELPRSILLKGLDYQLVELYYKFMVDVAEFFGANKSMAETEIKESLDLQIEIANISLSTEDRQNETLLYNPMTITKLEMIYPNTNWRQYIKYLLDIPEFEIYNDETVILRVPHYLNDLEELLKRTPKRTQANYIMWRVVSSSLKYLSKEMRDRKSDFIKAFTGTRQPVPRWMECIKQTLYRLWKPLRTLYDRKHFSTKSKTITNEISSSIETEFIKILHNTKWMDEDTKEMAFIKASSLKMFSSSFETESNEFLTKYYKKLDFNYDSYLKTVLSVSLFNQNKYFLNLRKPVARKEKNKDISLEYRIYVPGGIFQEVFFDNDQPYYMNYGGIGILMGHLITHEFDNIGRQFDKDGDLTDWWTEYTENAFHEQAQCFVEQYENYTVSEFSFKLNGNTSRDENIADSEGMKTAYLAYNAWVERNGPEPQLPGLNYTAQQMFWISAANVYCSKYRKEQLDLIILAYASAPDDYKVTSSLSNSEYFAKDFNCPLGSKMNPKEKCKIW